MTRAAYMDAILIGRSLTRRRLKAAASAYDLTAMLQNSSPSEVIYSYAYGFDSVVEQLLQGNSPNFNATASAVLDTAHSWEARVNRSFQAYKAIIEASRPKLSVDDAELAYSLITDLTLANFLKEFLFAMGKGFLRTHREAPIVASYLDSLNQFDIFMEQEIVGALYQGYWNDVCA